MVCASCVLSTALPRGTIDPARTNSRISSRHSNGGVTAALSTCHEKMPRLPNHSKNLLNSPEAELTPMEMSSSRRLGIGETIPASVVNPRSLTDLVPELASRANCSDACVKATNEVRYTGTPGQCCRPRIPAECNYPSEIHP